MMATTPRDSTLRLFKTVFWHCCLGPHSHMNPSERSVASQDLPQGSSQRVEIPKFKGLHGSQRSELALPQDCNVRTAPAHLKRIAPQKTIEELRRRWQYTTESARLSGGEGDIGGSRIAGAIQPWYHCQNKSTRLPTRMRKGPQKNAKLVYRPSLLNVPLSTQSTRTPLEVIYMNEAKYLPVTKTPLQPRSQPDALCTSARAEDSPPGEYGRTRTQGNTKAYNVVREGQKEVRGMDAGIL